MSWVMFLAPFLEFLHRFLPLPSYFALQTRGIYFHRKLKLFRDALKNLQNFSKIIIKIFRNYGWKLIFLSIFSCFHLNMHFLHEKSVNFLKNHQNFSANLPNFKTFPWWLSQPNEKYSSLCRNNLAHFYLHTYVGQMTPVS